MASSPVPNVLIIVGDNTCWRDINRHDGPIATRRGAIQHSMTRHPDIAPGEELTGYW